VDLGTVVLGGGHVGEDIRLGLVHQLGDFGPKLVCDLAPPLLGLLGVILGEGSGDEGRSDATTLPDDALSFVGRWRLAAANHVVLNILVEMCRTFRREDPPARFRGPG